MNFEFSEEQNLLREQAQKFLREQCPLETVRAVLDDREKSYDAELWQAITELGWTGVAIPEEYGGLGMGHLELCVIAEELGRSLAPTPYASSVYLAAEALVLFGSESQKQAWLPRLAAGEVIGTLAVAEGRGAPDPEKLDCSFSDGALSGSKWPVPDGDIADVAVVVVKNGADCSLALCDLSGDGIQRSTLESMDPTRSQARIDFDGASAELLGDGANGWAALQTLLDRAAVLFAFEQAGGAQASLEMAKDYAMERYAFGRPIASFQAIKHKLADMYITSTLARSNCYYGAWALSTGAPELPLAAATARVSATEAFNECSKENIQTHGGMGYAEETPVSRYFADARVLSIFEGAEETLALKVITRSLVENAA